MKQFDAKTSSKKSYLKLVILTFWVCASAVGNQVVGAKGFESRLFDKFLLENETPFVIGIARDLTNNKVLYKENHYVFDGGKTHIVAYNDSEGQRIAEKELSYANIKLDAKPKLEQYNYLSGERIKVAPLGLATNFYIEYQEATNERVEKKEIENLEGLVVDAGFNQFVIEAWSALVNNKKIQFEYLAPSQQKTFTFTAEREKCEYDGFNNRAVECFSIAPKSWLMRRFVNPISLVYDTSTKQLLRFTGLGNIGDANGDYMKVDIRYEYAEAAVAEL